MGFLAGQLCNTGVVDEEVIASPRQRCASSFMSARAVVTCKVISGRGTIQRAWQWEHHGSRVGVWCVSGSSSDWRRCSLAGEGPRKRKVRTRLCAAK